MKKIRLASNADKHKPYSPYSALEHLCISLNRIVLSTFANFGMNDSDNVEDYLDKSVDEIKYMWVIKTLNERGVDLDSYTAIEEKKSLENTFDNYLNLRFYEPVSFPYDKSWLKYIRFNEDRTSVFVDSEALDEIYTIYISDDKEKRAYDLLTNFIEAYNAIKWDNFLSYKTFCCMDRNSVRAKYIIPEEISLEVWEKFVEAQNN